MLPTPPRHSTALVTPTLLTLLGATSPTALTGNGGEMFYPASCKQSCSLKMGVTGLSHAVPFQKGCLVSHHSSCIFKGSLNNFQGASVKSSEADYPGAASLPSPCFSVYWQNSSAEAKGIRGPALLLVGLLSRARSPCLSGSNLFPSVTWPDLAGGSPQLHGDLAAAGQSHSA